MTHNEAGPIIKRLQYAILSLLEDEPDLITARMHTESARETIKNQIYKESYSQKEKE